jgi:hypothetical protein
MGASRITCTKLGSQNVLRMCTTREQTLAPTVGRCLYAQARPADWSPCSVTAASAAGVASVALVFSEKVPARRPGAACARWGRCRQGAQFYLLDCTPGSPLEALPNKHFGNSYLRFSSLPGRVFPADIKSIHQINGPKSLRRLAGDRFAGQTRRPARSRQGSPSRRA